MQISCDFDSGNIEVIDTSNLQRVLLAIRPDLNSAHFQWFHFKADGLQPGQRYGFSLVNAGQSSYKQAWEGYHAVASYDQRTWFRVPSRFEDGALNFDIEPQQAQIWFAYFEPYSRARHEQLIADARAWLVLNCWPRVAALKGALSNCCASAAIHRHSARSG